MNIILSGKMCAGKTTLAFKICEEYMFLSNRFATVLYNLVNALDDLSNEDLYDLFLRQYYILDEDQLKILYQGFDETRQIEKERPKPRKRLQYLGTDVVRNRIDKDFWVKVFKNTLFPEYNYVVDDCRFLNEFEAFNTDPDSYVLYLDITPEEQERRIKKLYGEEALSAVNHESEKELDLIKERINPKHIIDVNGSEEETFEQFKTIMDYYEIDLTV